MESTARAQPFLLLTEARPGEVKDPSHRTQEVTVHWWELLGSCSSQV